MSFGWGSTTDEVIKGISLEGKTAVITGAYSGLGFETARVLGKAGAKVVLLGRDKTKLEDATKQLKDMGIVAENDVLDLADIESCKECGARLVKAYPKIDIVVNNAGVMNCPYSKTKQGIEMQFGTNHIGHFVFTNTIIPAVLAAGPGSRIVNTSSGAHMAGDVDLDDYNFEKTKYVAWTAYGRSKTANILYSIALDAALKKHGVRVTTLHPGVILTNLARHMTQADKDAMGFDQIKFKSIPQGAATQVWAATHPDMADKGGFYCEDCQVASVSDDPNSWAGVRSYAMDMEKAKKLWELSEKLVGQKFEF